MDGGIYENDEISIEEAAEELLRTKAGRENAYLEIMIS